MEYKELIKQLRDESNCDVLDYIGDAADALETLLKEREADGWVSVEDRLPEEYDVRGHDCKASNLALVAVTDDFGERFVSDDITTDGEWVNYPPLEFEVTHWKPLPAPPGGCGTKD